MSCYSALVKKQIVALALAVAAVCMAQSPEAAPGVPLPAEGTVFAFDGHTLTRVLHSSIKLNRHAGSNIAKTSLAPLMFKPIATLELDGPTSAVHLQSLSPTFYYFYPRRIEREQGEAAQNAVALVKVSAVKDRRLVGGLSFGRITGTPERVFATVTCKSERVDEDWVRIVPQSKLEPGEYAITVLPAEKGEFDTTAYDFSVQP